MYAIIETGGSQHRISPGDTIKVQKLVPVSATDKEIDLSNILMISNDDNVLIGNPFVKNASVKAEILGNEKSPKVIVYKQKPRKNHRKLNGHRQNYTLLKIKDIIFGG